MHRFSYGDYNMKDNYSFHPSLHNLIIDRIQPGIEHQLDETNPKRIEIEVQQDGEKGSPHNEAESHFDRIMIHSNTQPIDSILVSMDRIYHGWRLFPLENGVHSSTIASHASPLSHGNL